MIIRYFPYKDSAHINDIYYKLDLVPWYNLKYLPSIGHTLFIKDVNFTSTEYEIIVKDICWIKPDMIHIFLDLKT